MAIQISSVPVTILAGGTTSNAVAVAGGTLVGIQLPSNWVTSTITFLVSMDGTNFVVPVDLTATAVGCASVAASKYVCIPAATTAGWQRIQIVAGSTQTSTDKILLLSFANLS